MRSLLHNLMILAACAGALFAAAGVSGAELVPSTKLALYSPAPDLLVADGRAGHVDASLLPENARSAGMFVAAERTTIETQKVDESLESCLGIASLPGLPSGFLLTLVGFGCIATARHRHRWAAFLIALLTVCQTSLGSLPRLSAVFGKPSECGRPAASRPVSPDSSSIGQCSYVREDSASFRKEVVNTNEEVSKVPDDGAISKSLNSSGIIGSSSHPEKFTAGPGRGPALEYVTPTLSAEGPAFDRETRCTLLPGIETVSPSCPDLLLELFVRPPPLAA